MNRKSKKMEEEEEARSYRSVERYAAFLLVDAVGGFRDPNPGEIGSEQVNRV